MKANVRFFYLVLWVLFQNQVFGQDIHFSQFFNSPLTLNPAETGNFDGDWRVVANYRNQWQSLGVPFRTISASYDRQIYIKKHHISAGLYFTNDKSGNIPSLKTSNVYLSGAYYREINKHQLTGGLQIGYVIKSIDFSGVTTPGQYSDELGYFDPGIVSGALPENNNKGYLDVNIGFSWKKKIRFIEPQVGFAFYHINQPNVSFYNNDYRLPVRSTLYAQVRTNLKNNIFIKPGIMIFSLKGAKDIMLGAEAGFAVPGNRYNIREIQGGFYVRNGLTKTIDAMIFVFGTQVSNLQFQISYDINVSPLNEFTNKRGAFEISIIYKSLSTIIKTFTIPCERF